MTASKRVAVTGANGFLGWHVRAALLEQTREVIPIAVGESYRPADALRAINQADHLIHIAGINRGNEGEVRDGNIRFARQVAEALKKADRPPSTVSFANSVQSKSGGEYGDAKAAAAEILREATDLVGARFRDVILPNLFGEHGRPFYNAVTATFSHMLANGDTPTIKQDKSLTLLHAQDAADVLIGSVDSALQPRREKSETISGLLARLQAMSATYSRGEIPDVAERFDRDLFNTYRSYTFPERAPIKLERHADSRGSFFEVIRTHGGAGQSSFSTTEPGISRGDHFHRRKIERFTVLAGHATISLRMLFSNDVIQFEVSGDRPVAVDMPTMWSHNIVNTGAETLFTSFWTNDIFDPLSPDTIAEPVQP